jgi:hypothetical protein
MKKTYRAVGNSWVETTKRVSDAAHMIMGDIQPYKSMIDGSMITSRSHHRKHLKDHECIEVGNEKMESKPPAPVKSKTREILHAQLANMTNNQADKIMDNIREYARFNRTE